MKTRLILLFGLLLAIFISSGQRFETTKLLDDRIEILVPTGLKPVRFNFIEEWYAHNTDPLTPPYIPKNVYMNNSESADFPIEEIWVRLEIFLIEEAKVSQENLPGWLSKQKPVFSASTILDEGIKDINGRKVGYIEAKMNIHGRNQYMLVFITDLDGQLLKFQYRCRGKNISKCYKKVPHKIMNSLKII